MPLAVGGDRKPGVGAGQERHPGGLRLAEIGAPEAIAALGLLDPALLRGRLVRLGEVDQVLRMGQGRA